MKSAHLIRLSSTHPIERTHGKYSTNSSGVVTKQIPAKGNEPPLSIAGKDDPSALCETLKRPILVERECDENTKLVDMV